MPRTSTENDLWVATITEPVARWYVLVVTSDYGSGRSETRRERVRAYNSEEAAARFRSSSFGYSNGKRTPTDRLQDVEPYEPDMRADHRTIGLHRGDKLDNEEEVR